MRHHQRRRRRRPFAPPTWLLLALGLLPAAAGAATTGGRDWDRYEIIMWHTHSAAQLATARRLGATAALMFGVRDAVPDAAVAAELERRAAPLRVAGLVPYVENIATDFYATNHRWQPGRALTWRFDDAQARHQRDPADVSAFIREPSLSDPAWLARIAARLAVHVRALAKDRPLYYSLGDETGIADLTAHWDFDLSPASLNGMRDWLRAQYGSLTALNAEWGTDFAAWDGVRPMLTDAALGVKNGNFAGWADFKAWMDTAFARAVRAGSDAVHAADPAARAAIEGAQLPGWGGYDYTQLAPAVDVMEITAGDATQDLIHALDPALVLLTTNGGGGAREIHGLWRALLAGARGTVLWDPDAQVAAADGAPGPRGLALAPVFAEFSGPLGTRLVAATMPRDAVAILYSPASFRTNWMLDRQADAALGHDWSRRRSETELEDNALRRATRRATDALDHLHLQPRWLSPAMLAGGTLRDGIKVLILPHALALSDAEIAAIRAFAQTGGTVLADVFPGGFDAHSRRRPAPLADGVMLSDFSRADLATHLAAAGVAPAFSLARADGSAATDVTVRVLRSGGEKILGVQRDLPAAGVAQDTEDLVLTLPQPFLVRDLRQALPAQRTARFFLRLGGVEPVLLGLSDAASGP
jgi:hypothetical protein